MKNKCCSKWIIDLNVKCKARKLLEDSTGENFDDFGYDDHFLDTIPKAMFMKEIINKLDFTKIKNVCSVKDKRMGRQSHRLKENPC